MISLKYITIIVCNQITKWKKHLYKAFQPYKELLQTYNGFIDVINSMLQRSCGTAKYP